MNNANQIRKIEESIANFFMRGANTETNRDFIAHLYTKKAALQAELDKPIVLPVLDTEASRAIRSVDAKFFIIQQDGSIKTRNDFGKLMQFGFDREQSARNFAARNNAFVFSRNLGRFI